MLYKTILTIIIRIGSEQLLCAFTVIINHKAFHRKRLKFGDLILEGCYLRGVCIQCTGLLEWSAAGMEHWTGVLEWSTGLECWNGALDWSAGMECWTGVLD